MASIDVRLLDWKTREEQNEMKTTVRAEELKQADGPPANRREAAAEYHRRLALPIWEVQFSSAGEAGTFEAFEAFATVHVRAATVAEAWREGEKVGATLVKFRGVAIDRMTVDRYVTTSAPNPCDGAEWDAVCVRSKVEHDQVDQWWDDQVKEENKQHAKSNDTTTA